MALDFGTTTGNVLRYLKGDNLVSDIDAGFQALAEDVAAKMLGFAQDTFAKRPGSTGTNRIFRATDTGACYIDTPTGWDSLFRLSGADTPTAFGGVATSVTTWSETPSAARASIVVVQIEAIEASGAVSLKVAGTTMWNKAMAAGEYQTVTVPVPPGAALSVASGSKRFSIARSYMLV